MIFTVLGAVAELERSLIAERVRAGLRNAKAKGKRLGRPAKHVNPAQVAALRAQGAAGGAVGAKLGVSAATRPRPPAKGVCKTPWPGCGKWLIWQGNQRTKSVFANHMFSKRARPRRKGGSGMKVFWVSKRLAFGSAITTWGHVEQLQALGITHVVNLRPRSAHRVRSPRCRSCPTGTYPQGLLGHPELGPFLTEGLAESGSNVLHLPLSVMLGALGLCVHGL